MNAAATVKAPAVLVLTASVASLSLALALAKHTSFEVYTAEIGVSMVQFKAPRVPSL